MKIIYTNTIRKDVRKIKNTKITEQVASLINTIEMVSSVKEIPNSIKMKGCSNAYRIRIGNYRLGFYLENNAVVLSRFLKREDIYKLFP